MKTSPAISNIFFLFWRPFKKKVKRKKKLLYPFFQKRRTLNVLFCLFGHILETDLIYLSDCSLFNLWVTCAIMVQITCWCCAQIEWPITRGKLIVERKCYSFVVACKQRGHDRVGEHNILSVTVIIGQRASWSMKYGLRVRNNTINGLESIATTEDQFGRGTCKAIKLHLYASDW